jgi:hypothetical protein
MAHAVYIGVQTASMVSGLSNKLMLSSVELAVHAAATALRALRPASTPDQQQVQAVTENPLVREELEQMDIEAKIRTVHALVLTIQKHRNGSASLTTPMYGGYRGQAENSTVLTVGTDNTLAIKTQSAVDDSDVIGVCLDQVKEVLESITSTVNALNAELEAHDTKWFSSWRTPDTKHLLLALKAKILILDKRVDMLLKVRSFFGNDAVSASTQRIAY